MEIVSLSVKVIKENGGHIENSILVPVEVADTFTKLLVEYKDRTYMTINEHEEFIAEVKNWEKRKKDEKSNVR